MEIPTEYVHCRLCAEVRVHEEVYNLDTKFNNKSSEIQEKLSYLNIDISINQPHESQCRNAVCFICYDSLNKAYEFLYKVKRAQFFYWNLSKQSPNLQISNAPLNSVTNDNCLFEEVLASGIQNASDIPDSKSEVLVKQETVSSDTDHIEHSVGNIEQDSISVQDILDAALNASPFATEDDNIEIYAKEVPMITPTDIPRKVKHKTYGKKSKINVENKTNTKAKAEDIDDAKTSVKTEVSWSNYPWICAYCTIEFHSIDMLREHAKAMHGKCGAFYCVDCKFYGWYKKKDDFINFVKHVRQHREELRRICHYCDCEVKQGSLNAHIAEEHIPDQSLTCLSCGEIVADEQTFVQHTEEYVEPRKTRRKPNTPVTEADLTCNVCNNVYKSLNNLRDHKKNQHRANRQKDYTCDRCGSTFYTKGTLTSHVLKHDNKKPHVCRICDKRFLFPNLLRRHVESHSGIKPFPCTQCPKRFRLRQQLANHLVVHSDHMPYRCQYCSKAFKFQTILKNHERQHTGAKPYDCKMCAMQFTCWSNYNKHMKRRHNSDMSRKKITAQGMLPVDPATGQVIQLSMTGLEEWKNQVMLPCKRGKKPAVKTESSDKE